MVARNLNNNNNKKASVGLSTVLKGKRYIISELVPNGPAALSQKLSIGDEILSVNDSPISSLNAWLIGAGKDGEVIRFRIKKKNGIVFKMHLQKRVLEEKKKNVPELSTVKAENVTTAPDVKQQPPQQPQPPQQSKQQESQQQPQQHETSSSSKKRKEPEASETKKPSMQASRALLQQPVGAPDGSLFMASNQVGQRVLGIDCEMVECRFPDGIKKSALARCAIVDVNGKELYHKFIKPKHPITNYRTRWSGVRHKDLVDAIPESVAQVEIRKILEGATVVGHALHNDFKVLGFFHPPSLIRDTSSFMPFRRHVTNGATPSLKLLAEKILKKNIQSGEHCPAEDARCAMRLYLKHRSKWEKALLGNKDMKIVDIESYQREQQQHQQQQPKRSRAH